MPEKKCEPLGDNHTETAEQGTIQAQWLFLIYYVFKYLIGLRRIRTRLLSSISCDPRRPVTYAVRSSIRVVLKSKWQESSPWSHMIVSTNFVARDFYYQ